MNPLAREAARYAPAHVLFPEAYEATKRQIVKDFAFFGAFVVLVVVVFALAGSAHV